MSSYLPARRCSSIVRIVFANPVIYFWQRHSLVFRTADRLRYQMRVAKRRLGFVVQESRTSGFWRPDQTEIHHPVCDLLARRIVCFSAGEPVKLEQPVHLCQAVFQVVDLHRGLVAQLGQINNRFSTTVPNLGGSWSQSAAFIYNSLPVCRSTRSNTLHGPLCRQI